MKNLIRSYLALVFVLCGWGLIGLSAIEEILFEDFEAEQALDRWTITSTNEGRVAIAEDPRGTGNLGLLMDDAVNNAVFSQNIAQSTINVGDFSQVRVRTDVLSLNNPVPFAGGFAGMVVRAGELSQSQSITWHVEQTLDFWVDAELLEAARAGDGYITLELHQYGNFSAPHNGLFFDKVRVIGFQASAIYVVAPLVANKSDPVSFTALIDPIPKADVELVLIREGQIHGTAVYPADALMAELTFPSLSDGILGPDRFYEFFLTNSSVSSSPFQIFVIDDTHAGLVVDAPSEIAEGDNAPVSVTVQAVRQESMRIEVESSDPSILTVPNHVWIDPRDSSVSFLINTVEDPRILPDREVTLTVRLGGDVIERTILVTEQNSLTPEISGPATVVEGSTAIEYSVWLNGVTDDVLTLELASDLADVTIQPSALTFAPGEREATFQVDTVVDVAELGDRAFTLTATVEPGGASGTFSGVLLNNTVSGFGVTVPKLLEADSGDSVTIEAQSFDGRPLSTYEGAVTLYFADAETGEETILEPILELTNGQATAMVNLPFEARGGRLIVRSTDGVEGVSEALNIFARLIFRANDLVYDATRETLYTVSGSIALAGHLHSVTRIDPTTAVIGDALFIGGEPENVVITDNGQFLYVGQAATFSVQRIDLVDFVASETIVLQGTPPWAGRSFLPSRLLPVPGQALDLIVAQDDASSSYQGTYLYRNGVMQPQDIRSAREIAAGPNPAEFFAFNTSNTGYDFYHLGLSDNGIQTIQSQRDLLSGFTTRIVGEGGWVFSSDGRILNGVEMGLVAELSFPAGWPASGPVASVYPERDLSRVYYARGNRVVAFDLSSFRVVEEIQIPDIGQITRMVRWGESGFALLTDQAEVVLLEANDLVPTGPATDLRVTIEGGPERAIISEDFQYVATIENISGETARDVRFRVDFSEGQSLASVASEGLSVSIEGNMATIYLGDVLPGEHHAITVTTIPNEITTLWGRASGITRSIDLNYADNQAIAVVPVSFHSEPESVNIIRIPTNDVVSDPISGQLVVSVGASAPAGIANHVLMIDPTNGDITQAIPLPQEPGMLALSDDGTTAYAASGSMAYRLNLIEGVVQQSFPFATSIHGGVSTPSSIAVVSGTNDTLASGFSTAASLYRDGARLPDAFGRGQFVAIPGTERLFSFNSHSSGFDSFLLEVGDAGLTLLQQNGGGLLTGFQTRIAADGNFVDSTIGRAVRADLMILGGTFPLQSVFTQDRAAAVVGDRAFGQRVYFADGKRIAAFDSESYLPVRSEQFDTLPANIVSLQRWGEDGFAARLQNGELAVIRSGLVSQSPTPIDLVIDTPEGAVTVFPEILLEGRAAAGQGIVRVAVNGELVSTMDSFANWSKTVTGLTPGKNTLTVMASSAGTTAATRTLTHTVHYLPELDSNGNLLPDSWSIEYFGSLDSPNADPDLDLDGDGRTNLAEYLFGTDPLAPDAPILLIRAMPEGNTYPIELEFVHRDTDRFVFQIEGSSNLIDWEPIPSKVTPIGEATPEEGRPHYLRSIWGVSAEGDEGSRFYRVRAVLSEVPE